MKNNVRTRLFLVLINLLIGVAATNAQIISTYAGRDSVGYGGDGGPATAAELHNPYSVVIDTSGNVYFTDRANNCIRKVATSGTITTFAGRDSAGFFGDGGPATAALFNKPGTMGIDAAGNIYVSDMGNNVIRRIGTNDTIYTIAGTGAYGFSGDGGFASAATFRRPNIAVDPFGQVYIADQGNFRIRKINTAGIISTIAGTGVPGYSNDDSDAAIAQMKPCNIAVDPSGNIFFTDSVSSVYRVIREINTATGIVNLFLNRWAEAFAFDPYGNVYFTDNACYVRRVRLSGAVSVYAGNSGCSFSGEDTLAIAAGIAKPTGLAFDGLLNLYVTESSGTRVRKITYAPTGIKNIPGNVETLKVYPNPATEEFTIEMSAQKEKVSVVISDVLGKVVTTRNIDGSNGVNEKFNVKNFVPGIYLIRINSGNKVYREKVSVK